MRRKEDEHWQKGGWEGYGCVCGFRIQNEVLVSEFCFCIFRSWNSVWGFLLLQWSENRGLVSLTQHHLTLRVLRLRHWKMIFLRNHNTGFYRIFSQIRAAYRALFSLFGSTKCCLLSCVPCSLVQKWNQIVSRETRVWAILANSRRGSGETFQRHTCQHWDIWGEGRVAHWGDPDSPN